MQLEYLCEIKLAYQDYWMVQPYDGGEGSAFGTGEGTVTGERIRGTIRWVNHPHRRSHNTWLPDTHGVIQTDDSAVILFTMQGRTVFPPNSPRRSRPSYSGRGRQLLTLMFEAEDERYAWLNTTLCVAEGAIVEGAMQARVYSCVNELVDEMV
jgi:hypothetical protein